jgi:flagellar motor switch protein FliG
MGGTDKFTGPQKAAIFLLGLGEEVASEIIKRLSEDEIKRIGGSFAKIPSVAPKALENIFTEFNDLANSARPIQIGQDGGSKFMKTILNKAVEESKANTILDEIQEEGKWNLFQKIRRLDPRTVSNFIHKEHPQTIAIILAHLDPGQAAAIMEEFPQPLQTDVIYRMAELDNVSPGVVEEIDQALQEDISLVKSFDGQEIGGVRAVAEILNQMDTTQESAILKGLEEQKQGLADDIRKLMFVFEDLSGVDDRAIMAILKEVNNDNLMMALKTATEGLKEKIFKNMSERAGQMLREDLEVMGPARLKDVEAAQQAIIKVAKKLETEGKIMLASGKGKEEVFV